MTTVVDINGRICGEQDAVISVFDHGFLFGDGVYEVVRTYGRQPFLFEPHQRRMRESAARIQLPFPMTDEEVLARIRGTIDRLPGDGEAYVRLLLTRGAGEFTYDPRACPTPTLVLIARPLAEVPAKVYEQGVTVALVDVVRNHPDSINPLIKSNNLLNNILAMQQAIPRGGYEALMRNHRGEIAECSQSNFFVVRRGEVLTPPIEAGLLSGVTRAFVIELGAAAGLPVRETTLHDEDLDTIDEAFLTSTTKEIVPIVRIDDRVVGAGAPGPVTRQLHAEFRRRAATRVRAAVRA
jgi:branched-chain amino acid aminotransferase